MPAKAYPKKGRFPEQAYKCSKLVYPGSFSFDLYELYFLAYATDMRTGTFTVHRKHTHVYLYNTEKSRTNNETFLECKYVAVVLGAKNKARN
jgi:hypothetical protein